MTNYVPLATQKRNRLIHRCGTAAIVVIYVLAAAALWLAPESWRWPIVGVAALLPPLIEFLLPPVTNRFGLETQAMRLPYLVIVSAVIGLLSAVILGPNWAMTALRWMVAALVALSALAAIVAWVIEDPELTRRKLTIIGIALFLFAMAAAVILGPPIVRSLTLGVVGALVLALLPGADRGDARSERRGPSRDRRAVWHFDGYDPRHDDDAYRYEGVADSASGRWSRPWQADDVSQVDPELQTLDRTFARAQGMIEDGYFPPASSDGRSLTGSPLMLSIAALNNLGFISGAAAQKFVKAAAQAILEQTRDPSADAALSGLYRHIDYARAQLRAHTMGARNPSFPSSG